MAGGAKTSELIARGARLALAAVFVYAGVLKALDPGGFALAIDNYHLLPFPLAATLALYLPWLEILCGFGVLWPRLRLGALGLLAGLCLVFTGALALALVRGLDIDCGCFGHGLDGRPALIASLVRAVLLAVVAAVLLRREGKVQTETTKKPGTMKL